MSFRSYLEAKKTVESRHLDRDVLEDVAGRTHEGAEILEAGAGIGSMVQHLVEHEAAPDAFSYTAVDIEPENVERARERLADWGERRGYTVERSGETVGFEGAKSFEVTFREGDLYDESGSYDLVVAHAVLDILRLDRAVEHLLSLGEAFYFPVCFDGVTAFEPAFDESFEGKVESAYHGTMDADGRAGSSRTGRQVFEAVRDAGGTVTEAGSSDWVVFPDEDGYTEDEEVLMRHVLKTVYGAVSEVDVVENDRLDAWLEDRQRRLEEEELVFVAHNIDVSGLS